MFPIALALLAAAPVVAPAPAPAVGNIVTDDKDGAITANYHAGRGVYCIRSGWRTAEFGMNLSVRRGDCRTAADWRAHGLAFDRSTAVLVSRTDGRVVGAKQVATR